MNIDSYAKTILPNDWNVTKVLDDVILAEYVDGEGDLVDRGGILVSSEVTHQIWRVAKVVLKGNKCSDTVQIDDYILIPNDKGIKHICREKNKFFVFINEERIFGVVEKIKKDA